MKENWVGCKNILVIRADNMGDLLMSSPAIRAVKETLRCKITVLTSSMGQGIVSFITEIDEVIVCDLPWVKTNEKFSPEQYFSLIEKLKAANFDGAIVFTVYSQNPLPSVMMAYLSGIPHRLAYCRENPYELLTDWVPEKEPYTFIRHQVRRDLELVGQINCRTSNENLSLKVNNYSWPLLKNKLQELGLNDCRISIVLHAGVSEQKREYPFRRWVETGKLLLKEFPCQLVLTGNSAEAEFSDKISAEIGEGAISVAGKLDLQEFISLIRHSALVISVNTGTIHIAAALDIPIIVLYALTNPQHSPWKAKGEIMPFNVSKHLKSKNEVIKYVNDNLYSSDVAYPSAEDVVEAAKRIVTHKDVRLIPEIITSSDKEFQTIGRFSCLPASPFVNSASR